MKPFNARAEREKQKREHAAYCAQQHAKFRAKYPVKYAVCMAVQDWIRTIVNPRMARVEDRGACHSVSIIQKYSTQHVHVDVLDDALNVVWNGGCFEGIKGTSLRISLSDPDMNEQLQRMLAAFDILKPEYRVPDAPHRRPTRK